MTKSPNGFGKIERRDGGRQVRPANRRAVSARLGFDFRRPLGKGGAGRFVDRLGIAPEAFV